MADSFATRAQLDVNGKSFTYFSLPTLGQRFDISKLPFSMKILLENLLRHEDGGITVGKDHIEAVAQWDCKSEPDIEMAFMPARVVLQDFTGVPCVVDLAAMRDAVGKLGGKASQIAEFVEVGAELRLLAEFSRQHAVDGVQCHAQQHPQWEIGRASCRERV